MKLLIVSATLAEIQIFASTPYQGAHEIDTLVTGVGMMATTYVLAKHLQTNPYDLVLQVGVGGNFNENISLGAVVFISSDRYGDLGTEDHNEFLDIFQLGLLKPNDTPHSNGLLLTPLLPIHDKLNLPHANAITVNSVSGSERTIKLREEKYGCDVESMEGAAFHFVCLREKVPFAQVRAISNYVTPRDKSQWKMKEAIINLNNWLIGFIERL